MGDLGLVRRNSVFLLLAIFTRLLTNALLFIGIARFYGPEEFGQFALAHVYFSILLLVADFGYDYFLTTEIGRNRDDGLGFAARIFPLKIIFSSLAALLMIFFALVVTSGGTGRWLMIILSVAIPANALMLYAGAILRGSQDLLPEARVTFVQNLLLLVLLIGIGVFGLPFLAVPAAFVVSRLFGMAGLLKAVRARYPEQPFGFSTLRTPGLGSILAVGVTFGVHMLCSTLYFQIDTIMLDKLAGGNAVALYQSVFKIAMIILIVNDVVDITLVPVLARAFAEHQHRWTRLGGLVSRSLWLLGGLGGMVFILCPAELLDLVYGEGQFTAASGVTRIFGVILLVRFAMTAYAIMLTTAGMQRHRTIVVFLATVVNVAANLVVIPRAGLVGAAWVALGTNVFVAVSYASLLSWRFRRLLPLNRWSDTMIPVSFAAAGAVLWAAGTPHLAIAVPVLLAVAVGLIMVSFSAEEQRTVIALFGVRLESGVKAA